MLSGAPWHHSAWVALTAAVSHYMGSNAYKHSLRFRWLAFASAVKQSLPCLASGEAVHPDAKKPGYCMPPGYTEPDTGQHGLRDSWTSPRLVEPETWRGSNALKYSAQEIMARGRRAAMFVAMHAAGQMSKTATAATLNTLGVKGMPMFSDLSYFKSVPRSPSLDLPLVLRTILSADSNR